MKVSVSFDPNIATFKGKIDEYSEMAEKSVKMCSVAMKKYNC
jgi:hypothetical protein